MQIVFKNRLEAKVNPFCLISLLMKEFLLREALDSESRLKNWLNAVDQVQVKSWGTWADLTTRVVLKVAMKDFCSTLERSLSESERHFLAASVREFVEVFGRGRLKVLKSRISERKGETSC